MKAAAVALLSLALAACGGGGSSDEPTAPVAQVAAACAVPAVVRIQLFGDSTQWGYLAGGGGERASIYPELALQQRMDLRFGRGAVVVSTRAVSGTASGHLLNGTDGLNAPWPQSVDADIVVINHGVNDVANGTTAEGYRKDLLALASGPARVVFETPLPVLTATTDYADVMRAVAAETGTPVIDARAYALSVPGWFTQFATDGVHETSQGYQAISDNVLFPALEPMVRAMRCPA